MSVTGERDGDPVRCGVSVVDLGSGMASVIAVLSALRERDRTGRGQYVEPALMRTAMNFLNYQIAGYSLAAAEPKRLGSGHEALVPYRNFNCVDGAILIAAGNDRLWPRLCLALGIADAEGQVPFAALAMRIANRDAVNAMVSDAVSGRRRQELLDILECEGIPCAPVNTLAEYMQDPTLAAAGVLENVEVLPEQKLALAGALFEADFLPHDRRPPPGLGQHTAEVLESLGYADAEIGQLRDSGAIG